MKYTLSKETMEKLLIGFCIFFEKHSEIRKVIDVVTLIFEMIQK